MESEFERARLAEDYPHWRVWRNRDLAHAWLAPAESLVPPVKLADTWVAGLRQRLERFEDVLSASATGSLNEAEEAAQGGSEVTTVQEKQLLDEFTTAFPKWDRWRHVSNPKLWYARRPRTSPPLVVGPVPLAELQEAAAAAMAARQR